MTMVLNQMVFHRRRMTLRPVNRLKHVVDNKATTSLATVGGFVIADAVQTPTLANTNEVNVGCTINGFYIRLEAASNDAIVTGAIPNYYMMIAKNPGNNVTMPAPDVVGASDNKRFVIHQEMTMIENKGQGSNPRTIFNGVVVVPKGMRRMAPDDQWKVHTLSPQLDTAACIQVHYKEFR